MSWQDEPHAHDEEGNCVEPGGQDGYYAQALPTWKFSLWDVAGIAATGIAGLFTVTGQALNLLSRECAAMANWKRQSHDIQQAEAARREAVEAYEAHQREMAETLRALVEGPATETPEEGS